MQRKKRILVSPLDWGLGHATRCIPIINYLLKKGNEVLIAAHGRSLDLLKIEFPRLDFFEIPGYNVVYKSGNASLDILWQSPEVLRQIKAENEWINNNIEKLNIDAIISDNRYGLHHPSVPCALITHQLNIPSPTVATPIVRSKVKSWIKNFDTCWVPDYEGTQNLSGKLSHGGISDKKIQFIGPLSRLKKLESSLNFKYKYLGLVSGPENQRTIFENLLTKILKESGKKSLLVCAKPDEDFTNEDENLTLVPHLSAMELSQAIAESEVIICRSGYSTIMDLTVMERSAILVPTPGQPEQEYLGRYLSDQGLFTSYKQKDLKLESILSEQISNTKQFPASSFESEVDDFLLSIN